MALTAVLALGACGGDDPSPLDEAATSDDPAQEQTAEDEQALEQLATDLWAARQEAQVDFDPSIDRFENLLVPELIEIEVGDLQRFNDLGVTREGGPELTAIEAEVAGDSGTVLLCVNEDDWVAYEEGREIEGEDLGSLPVGFTAEGADGEWLINAFLPSEDVRPQKSC